MIKSEEALLNALGRMQELATAFPTAELNQLSERLLAEKPDLRLLMGELPAETASLLSRALEQAENLIDPVSTALDCVNGLARAQLESRMADLSAAYNGSPEAAAEIMELQRRIGKLSRRA